MNLFLFRHGLAAESGLAGVRSDRDRPLTEEGRDKTRRIARGLQALELGLDLILSSPYRRARETAEIVAEEWDLRAVLRLTNRLVPGAPLSELISEMLDDYPGKENVMWIGHEPDLSTHAAVLTSGKEEVQIELKKAGLCKLAIDSLAPHRCGTLQWLLPPKLLLRLK